MAEDKYILGGGINLATYKYILGGGQVYTYLRVPHYTAKRRNEGMKKAVIGNETQQGDAIFTDRLF